MARYSIFREIIGNVRDYIANVNHSRNYDEQVILEIIKNNIVTWGKATGFAYDKALRYTFEPLDNSDLTKYDDSIYENVNNLEFNYGISLENAGSDGVVESISKIIYDKQIALVTLLWTEEGTTGAPVLDISFDKDRDEGDTFRGTFLANAGRIDAIQNGSRIDVSGIPSKTFSVKWTIPAGSDYKILDTIAKVLLIDSSKVMARQTELAHITAAEILNNESLKAIKDGQSEVYVRFLEDKSKHHYNMAKSVIGDSSAPSPEFSASGHSYNVDSYANKLLKKNKNEEWVEIIGNDIKVIRYVDDN